MMKQEVMLKEQIKNLKCIRKVVAEYLKDSKDVEDLY